jgi:hypothetical protein
MTSRAPFDPNLPPTGRGRPPEGHRVGTPLLPRTPLGIAITAAAVLAAAAGLVQLALHGRLFAARVSFPLDLEWMEGGTLVHALRVSQGQPLYVKPSVDFIPFLYTPLYYVVLAGLSKLVPLGYTLARTVSLVSFAGALALLVMGALRESPRARLPRLLAVLVGVAGAGAVTAGFEFSGAFFDLARADSLLLLLEAAALAAAFWGNGWPSAAGAGICMALAFLTKQTGPVVGIGIGVGLLVASWRRALVYGAVSGVLMGLGLLYLVKSSGGWFWTYIFKLHQSHPFRYDTLTATPMFLWNHAWPALLALLLATAGLALSGRLRRPDAVLWATALAGIAAGILGFATMWAWPNAYIPSVYFPLFAAAALTARLLAHAAETRKVGAAALAATCALALGLQSAKAGKPLFKQRMPTAADRAAAARFLGAVRALPGDGFIPFHPFYSVLAGKRPFVHRMGVMDVRDSLGRPEGLDQAIRDHRFPWIVLDWKSQPGEWPFLDARYRPARDLHDGVDTVRSFAGADTWPRSVWVPVREPPPLPPGGHRVADFESGNWAGWQPEGGFGGGPATARDTLFGRYAADSARFGASQEGALRSPPFLIDRKHLRFVLDGAKDAALRVRLLDGAETARALTPQDGVTTIDWDVSDLRGHQVVLVLEDRSPTHGLAVDEVVLY